MFPNHSNTFSTTLSGSFISGDFHSGEVGGSGGERSKANIKGEKKGNFCKNIVPVEIKTILNHREDEGSLMVHGIQVGLVCVVAQIRDVLSGSDADSTTRTFLLEDDSGRLEAVQYLQEESVLPVLNTWAKIIGKNSEVLIKLSNLPLSVPQGP